MPTRILVPVVRLCCRTCKDASGQTRHLAVGAGKDGNIYVVDRDSMGKFNSQNNDAIYQEISGAIGQCLVDAGLFQQHRVLRIVGQDA